MYSSQFPLPCIKISLSYECPIWLTFMVIWWRSIGSFWHFYFFSFLNIRFSISPLYIGTEGPFNSLFEIRPHPRSLSSSIWWRCVFFNGKAIISTERTPSSCLESEKRENKRQLWSMIMKTGYVNRYIQVQKWKNGITVNYNGNIRTKDVI